MSMFFAALLLAQPSTPPIGQRTTPPARLIVGASLIPDADEDPLIAAAAGYPLGSAENPVRVGGPKGESAYLARLRCSDGSTPGFVGRSDGGVGAFGSIVSTHRLSCGAAAAELVIDMYHGEHVEDRAPPGFSILPR